MHSILLATDGSPSARLATDRAVELASSTGWPLRVVVVWSTPSIAGEGYPPAKLLAEISEAEREHAGNVAEAAVELARAAGAEATAEVREGDPAEEICAAAAETGATVVVVGAHGWGTVKRLLFGSVSTRVLHEAPCGVLVVPAPDEGPTHAAAA